MQKVRSRTPRVRDSKGRTANQARFLDAYAKVGIIGLAAEMAGISRRTHILWLQKDHAYPELFQQAHDECLDRIAVEMTRLAEVRRRAADLRFRRAVARRRGGRL